MSSTIDPAKLKVVELRNELQERGLDTKGNKAALVQRLKEALEKETNTSLPNSSILETSTEDLDTSQNEDSQEPPAKQVKLSDEKMEVDSCPKPETTPKTPEKSTTPASTKTPEKPKVDSPAKVTPSPAKPQESKPADEKKDVAENGEQAESGDKEAAVTASESQDAAAAESKETTAEKSSGETEQKGEKRKRDSDSPDRDSAQKVRAKSPIREDEPIINNDNVQLNWYDSDLHLQVDKESLLSAKPFSEGAFGYAWAGVRASHGVSKGKVCYEVKITEEIKWEDLSKLAERNRQDMKRNQKRDRDKRGKKSDEKKSDKPSDNKEKGKAEKKSEEKKDEKTENGDKENAAEGTSKDSTENKEGEAEKKEEQKSEQEEKMDTTAEEKPAEETPMETETAPATDEAKKTDTDAAVEKKEDANKDSEKPAEEEKKETEEELPIHLVRVGWSLLTSSLQLGEDKCSFAYESTGKFVNDKQFIDYGKSFAVGDVVGAYLTIDDEYVTIRYTVNGEIQPVAGTLQKSDFPEGFVLFPHVLTRNCAFEINLGQKEEPWFPAPDLLKDYVFLSKLEDKVAGPIRPETRSECEVILMCGLPGSGKTNWVKEHIGSNADKRYTVIGNTSLLEKMTVAGDPLRSKFKGKWSIFVDRLQKCLNALISLASQRRRNYIIDQTNVFPSAQRRKMRPFEGFKRKAVIVVVGDEEQSKRQALQESTDGKGVPDSVILEMKAAMSIPQKGDWMDEVIFAGLDEEATKEQVKKYNEAGKAAGYGTEKRFRFKGERYHPRKPSFRGGRGDRDRNFRDRRLDSRGGRWGPRGGGGGGGGGSGWRDRSDRRGPPPPRDYRAGGRDYGGSRDYGRRDSGGYNRSRNLDRVGGGGGGRWSGGGGGDRRSGGGYGGGWQQQSYGNHSGYGGWGGSQGGDGGGRGQWKYGGGGQGYGGGGYGGGGQGGGSWNYYGQYSQNQNWGHK